MGDAQGDEQAVVHAHKVQELCAVAVLQGFDASEGQCAHGGQDGLADGSVAVHLGSDAGHELLGGPWYPGVGEDHGQLRETVDHVEMRGAVWLSLEEDGAAVGGHCVVDARGRAVDALFANVGPLVDEFEVVWAQSAGVRRGQALQSARELQHRRGQRDRDGGTRAQACANGQGGAQGEAHAGRAGTQTCKHVQEAERSAVVDRVALERHKQGFEMRYELVRQLVLGRWPRLARAGSPDPSQVPRRHAPVVQSNVAQLQLHHAGIRGLRHEHIRPQRGHARSHGGLAKHR